MLLAAGTKRGFQCLNSLTYACFSLHVSVRVTLITLLFISSMMCPIQNSTEEGQGPKHLPYNWVYFGSKLLLFITLRATCIRPLCLKIVNLNLKYWQNKSDSGFYSKSKCMKPLRCFNSSCHSVIFCWLCDTFASISRCLTGSVITSWK